MKAATQIMKDYPNAVYTHCSSHFLNLCIVNSAKESDVRNVIDVAGSAARFFSNSPKRQLAFEKCIDDLHNQQPTASKSKKFKRRAQHVG